MLAKLTEKLNALFFDHKEVCLNEEETASEQVFLLRFQLKINEINFFVDFVEDFVKKILTKKRVNVKKFSLTNRIIKPKEGFYDTK